ncbi:MAG: hypothetical protein ACPF9D_09970, partial [Owenweeksia sp.]
MINPICAALAAQDSIANYIAMEAFVDSLSNEFLLAYMNNGLTSATEGFTMAYSPFEYAYTLYYYDQSGNLVKTVPPSGVSVLNSSELTNTANYRSGSTSIPVFNNHTYVTTYKFNSLDQKIQEITPDGGLKEFWYDLNGRMVLSRSAQQRHENRYSYIVYDNLGRNIESGEIKDAGTSTEDYDHVKGVAENPVNLETFITGKAKNDIVLNIYDRSYIYLSGALNPIVDEGKNLRGRLGGILRINSVPSGITPYGYMPVGSALSTYYEDYESAIHFEYDVLGNTTEVTMSNPEFFGNRNVVTRYSYDLISGNIKEVQYQPGGWDEFYHKYYYDSDNRLAHVFTSRHGKIWERDVNYHYYPHGPLKRSEVGDWHIQGKDYPHSLNGWSKGVNSSLKSISHDPGSDGDLNATNIHRNFSDDVYGFTLGYFPGDYISISGARIEPDMDNALFTKDSLRLYNGNISSVVTALWNNNENDELVNGTGYLYDNLNRIKESLTFEKSSSGVLASEDFSGISHNNKFHTQFAYSLDGDLEKVRRWDDAGSVMDSLNYNYYTNTHRLKYVNDAAGDAGKGDVDDQNFGNYTYDLDGNMISDDAEGISEITWTVAGKIHEVKYTNNATSDIEFRYDPFGYRMDKILKPKDGSGDYLDQDKWTYYHYVNDTKGK